MPEVSEQRTAYEDRYGTYRRRVRFAWRKLLHLIARFSPGTTLRLRCYRAMGIQVDRDTTYIGPDCYLDDIYPELVSLGPGVIVSFRVTMVAHDHVSDSVAAIVVEDGAFIGTGSIILPGVRIGRNAVVAAGAVVSGDVPPDTVVGGVPAKPIQSSPRS
jgi:acetyltransferase-like isoleucine patch superfamily enzyme